jgi:hypothetical protein
MCVSSCEAFSIAGKSSKPLLVLIVTSHLSEGSLLGSCDEAGTRRKATSAINYGPDVSDLISSLDIRGSL